MPADRYRKNLVGRNIHRARKANGNMSQEALVKRLRDDYGVIIDRRLVSVWERGVHEPRSHRLRQIAEILGVDFGYFYTEHDLDQAASMA